MGPPCHQAGGREPGSRPCCGPLEAMCAHTGKRDRTGLVKHTAEVKVGLRGGAEAPAGPNL